MTDNRLLIGYYRLSMEDDTDNESNSITNQRLLIKDYISAIPELLAMPYQEFYDDGYSGASMERPAMQQVLQLVRQNRVQCIVVKDFSRFSRNYIEMGTYLEQVFPLWVSVLFQSRTITILWIIEGKALILKSSSKG